MFIINMVEWNEDPIDQILYSRINDMLKNKNLKYNITLNIFQQGDIFLNVRYKVYSDEFIYDINSNKSFIIVKFTFFDYKNLLKFVETYSNKRKGFISLPYIKIKFF